MKALKSANLAVRSLRQLCALAPLAYRGARTWSRLLVKVALGVGAPQPRAEAARRQASARAVG